MAVVMNGELIQTYTLQCELTATGSAVAMSGGGVLGVLMITDVAAKVNFQPGHQDTFLGAPPWEYGRSTTASAWAAWLFYSHRASFLHVLARVGFSLGAIGTEDECGSCVRSTN